MHIKFLDLDGDIHVAPADKVYLDSVIEDKEFHVSVYDGTDSDYYEVSKEEFARLVKVLTGD